MFFVTTIYSQIIEEQLAMSLFCLSTNASNRSIQEWFQHSDCIGAIDGTHVPITISTSLQDPYYNRKGGLSQNVMVVCDFNGQFVHVSAGWEGSAADARVLLDALAHGFSVSAGKNYLVDAGYANTPNFIAPYRNVRYHLQEQGRSNQRPNNAKEIFNLRHTQLRNHVERIIGVLKMCFPILKCTSHYLIDTQTDIVLSTCVVHNFIKRNNRADQWLNEESMEVNPSDIVNILDGDQNYGEDVFSLNERRRTENVKRNQIAQDTWDDYLVYIVYGASLQQFYLAMKLKLASSMSNEQNKRRSAMGPRVGQGSALGEPGWRRWGSPGRGVGVARAAALGSLWHGVPLVLWPLLVEQHLNAFELVSVMGVAVAMEVDRKRGNFVEAVMEGLRAREKAAEAKALRGCPPLQLCKPSGGGERAAARRGMGRGGRTGSGAEGDGTTATGEPGGGDGG
ncbi:hypothetical protein U9M48_042468 [Paspalum notatum var. saurae]|uniref:DDE Tnp4 domain-containing protein n=1 Tax=Paspalum notatum var. saurae TaxID=547442 RepID=A0AAQ3UVD2_PASNO